MTPNESSYTTPVTFHSHTISKSKARYSTAKKAATVIDAVRKWTYYLYDKQFTLLTDQKAASLSLNPFCLGIVKNMIVQMWSTELGNFDDDTHNVPRKTNLAADALSSVCNIINCASDLENVLKELWDLRVTQLSHFFRIKTLNN